jgi:hypothetical protein
VDCDVGYAGSGKGMQVRSRESRASARYADRVPACDGWTGCDLRGASKGMERDMARSVIEGRPCVLSCLPNVMSDDWGRELATK